MCTVTILSNPNTAHSFRLYCNRDEQHTRAPATPPAASHLTLNHLPPNAAGKVASDPANPANLGNSASLATTTPDFPAQSPACLMPIDPVSGGTWVGVNAHGVAATLLNYNAQTTQTHQPHPTHTHTPATPTTQTPLQSRGLIVPEALKHPTAKQAALWATTTTTDQPIDPTHQLPFRLVIVDANDVELIVSDGHTLTHQSLGPPSRRHFFTSSGLGDHLVAPPRQALFNELLANTDPQTAYDNQADFHNHHWPDKPELSVLMHRQDARTVSQTVITVTQDQAQLIYTPTPAPAPGSNLENTLASESAPSSKSNSAPGSDTAPGSDMASHNEHDGSAHSQTDAASVSNTLSPQPPKPSLPKRGLAKWGLTKWRLYLLLLLASALFQTVRDAQHQSNLSTPSVQTPAMSPTGPIPTPTQTAEPNSSKNPTQNPVRITYQSYGPGDDTTTFDVQADITIIAIHGCPTGGQDFKHFAPALIQAIAATTPTTNPTTAPKLAPTTTPPLAPTTTSPPPTPPTVRLIAPVMPGFGESQAWVPNYGCDAQAHYALAVMDELGIQQAHLLGYSLGGGTITRMAQIAPERVLSFMTFGGIGAQSVEGTGDWAFEHFKYAAAYATFVVGFEAVPHFGLLGSRKVRHGFARSFWDTDQRPYEQILANLPQDLPVLIVNGLNDPLVPPQAARLHHQLIQQSELVMLNAGHGDLLFKNTAQQIAEPFADFLYRTHTLKQPATRSTFDPGATKTNIQTNEQTNEQINRLTKPLKLKDNLSPWAKLTAIAGATFISEDYTCISVGLLINTGHTDLFLGVLACFLGIFIGDILLFLTGRVAGQRVLKWGPIQKWASTQTLEEICRWYEKYGFVAVFASRFMPGTRFPLYVTAGVVGSRASKFILWAAISDIIYTPLIVILVATFGHQVASPLTTYLGQGWLAVLLTALILLIGLRLVINLLTQQGRQQLAIKLAKCKHHEWWPAWLFYLPMIPIWLFLCIKYRTLTAWTCANPAIPDGGIVGESKADILAELPQTYVLPWVLIDAQNNKQPHQQDLNLHADCSDDRANNDVNNCLTQLKDAMQTHGWSYPIILKPNVGERGAAVAKITNDQQAQDYFSQNNEPIIAQVYDPGPYECGIFYVRHPQEDKGYIFAITDKTFPQITGDGEHTLKQLIFKHPRYRFQNALFLKRFRDQRHQVLDPNQTLALTNAGNHAQGCMFTDGVHLYTDVLCQVIDEIAQAYDGFYFGRFDIRYQDPAQLREGIGVRIVELNGVTSEATNLYDPSWSPIQAYTQLYKQWHWCFRIGRYNADHGHPSASIKHLLGILFSRFRTKPRPISN